VAYFSEKKDAIPIVFMHGWPGSFIEFLPMLENVRKQYDAKNLPYHIIIPSLPGYTLSAPLPTDKNWTMELSAEIIHKLMINLGFEKYLAQGGDVGSFEARILAHEHEECVAIHREYLYISSSGYNEADSMYESEHVRNPRPTRHGQNHRLRETSPRKSG
jgi:pimeloyl-ACP methyl ester carboxylesterase